MTIPVFQSNLTSTHLKELESQIRDLYRSQKMPWIVGYSGGKDSTATLQLVWKAISHLPVEERIYPIYVLSSDTLVETPVIVDYIDTTLGKINVEAVENQMPFEAHKVVPKLEDTFWVNLIGKGYPAPYNRFRWCTDRLKIKPANNFILNKVSEFGEVIVVLGVRKSESATRAQSMSLQEIENNVLRHHSTLPNAFVYAPIEDFSTQDVWSYLLNVESPWGNDNRDLIAIYQDAQSGECPLVVDTTTPSCGNSRFGCWVCTVVQKDHSMEALIDSGEDWLEPLLDLRDFLASTQEAENKKIHRGFKRMNGTVTVKEDGEVARGPYTLEFCKNLLGMLLDAEKTVNEGRKSDKYGLISEDELHMIRDIWRTNRQDWEDSVPKIVKSHSDHQINWPVEDLARFDNNDKILLQEIADSAEIPADLLAKLIDTENEYLGVARRSGIFDRLNSILAEEWRTEQEITKSVNEPQKD